MPAAEGFIHPGVKLPNRMSPRLKEVSATTLYEDYFPYDHSLPSEFFLVCGFTHQKYAIRKEYKLSLCDITGLHIAAQQSWTASSISTQRELLYLRLLQPHKSKEGW